MHTWQSGNVEANSIQLHYTRTGGSKPPIVLAHGVMDDGLCWTPVAEVLAPDYDVVMVDARGHGRSSKPQGGYDPITQAGDLHDVIQALGLVKPVLIGHSMGAITALVLAGLHPEVPRAAVLEDPPHWWLPTPEDKSRVEFVEGLKAWASGLKSQTREALIAGEHANSPNWSDAELAVWADAKLRFDAGVIDYIFGPNPSTDVPWPEVLKCVTCPLLVITGDPARGAILNSDTAAALQKHIPHLRVENIPGAGHSIRRDQFARYMEVVRAFLAELAD